MAEVHWKSQISADFATGADWVGGAAPGAADDAILDASGSTAYVVTASTSHTVLSLQTAATATLAVTHGTFIATDGTGAGTNTGTIAVDGAATFEAGGTVAGAGLISLSGSGASNLVAAAAGLTLSGGGDVSLAAGATRRIEGVTASATLTNVNDTITGTGYLGLNSLTLVNQAEGVIEASGGTLTVATAGQTLVNAGVMEAAAGGLLAINSTTVANAGGTITAANGAHVNLYDVDIQGGRIGPPVPVDGLGVLVTFRGTGNELDGTGQQVELNSSVRLENGASLTLAGAIDGVELNLYGKTADTDLIIASGVASLGIEINLENSPFDRIIGATLTTALEFTGVLRGGGQLGAGQLTLDNNGFVEGNAATALVIDTGANTIQNTGTIESAGAGGVTIDSPIANGGLIKGGGSQGLTIDGGVVNNGVLEAGLGNLTVTGAVTGTGTAKVVSGTLAFDSTFDQNVSFQIGGELQLADSQDYTATLEFGRQSFKGDAKLDLRDIEYGDHTKVTKSTNGILVITDGVHTATLHMNTDPSFGQSLSSDGHGGTLVEFQPNFSMATTTSNPGISGRGAVHGFLQAAAGLGATDAADAEVTGGTSPVFLTALVTHVEHRGRAGFALP